MCESIENQLCDPALHLSRRSLLGVGLGGLMMSGIARRLAVAAEPNKTDRPKNLILLWMHGAPSQLETFDPHPGGMIGGDVTAIDTSVKGLQISNLLPQTAEVMHLGSLVRSVTGKEGDHERAIYNIRTGYRPDPTLRHPSVGAVLCHDVDQRKEKVADIPIHISISPGDFNSRGGYLGARFDPFKISDPAGEIPDIKTSVQEARYGRRLDLMSIVENEFARGRLKDLESERTQHRTATADARTMMSSDQLDAFDVLKEPRAVRQAFGENTFGRGCLAASRLIEAGARAIEVRLGGWDSHINNHDLQSAGCETLDPALASLLRRLEDRDQLSNTLVVCAGEFGRTPQINPAAGRDHWPHGFSVFMAGCGIRRGTVFGATAPNPKLDKDKPMQDVENPVAIGDLHATILSALGIEYDFEEDTPIGRPLKRAEGQPIRQIMV